MQQLWPGQVLRSSDLVAAGWSQRQVSRGVGRLWTRPYRGILVVAPDHENLVTRARAAWTSVGSGSCISHQSAAALLQLPGALGLVGFTPLASDAIDLTVSRTTSVRHRSGVRLHRHSLSGADVQSIHGLPVTSLERTLQDLLVSQPTELALVALDFALHAGLLRPGGLDVLSDGLSRRWGAARGRATLALAEARSESPLESLSRLRFLKRGLVPTAIQPVIRDRHGRLVARADFGFGNRSGTPTVLGEADGRSAHNQPGMRLQDARREESLRLLGFEVVRWDWAELARDPDAIVARIRAFLALASRVA